MCAVVFGMGMRIARMVTRLSQIVNSGLINSEIINLEIKNLEKLSNLGYKVFVIWECEIKRKGVLQEKLQVLYDYLNTHHNLGIEQKPN